MLHHKKKDDGEESSLFALSDSIPVASSPPLLPLFHPPRLLQIPPSDDNPSPNAHLLHHLALSTPHKRPSLTPSPSPSPTVATAATSFASATVGPRRSRFSAASTGSALCQILRRFHLRLRLFLLLSFPSLYLLFSSSSASSSSFSSSDITRGRSFLLDFFSALAFSSVLLLLLFSLHDHAFPLPSLRLLLSRSSALLLPRHHHPRPPPVLWSIGDSSAGKPGANRGPTSGYAVQAYSNGDVYEGEFHKGKCAGSGVYHYYMSGRYEGDWVDDKYDGYGVETWARGSRYRGQYRHGLRHGVGVYRFYTGDVFAGEWSNGQSHGRGMHTCEDGSRYVGEFKWGVKHGFGHYHFRNGDTYAGEYFADKMHGFGVYRFANGHRYEGSWHEGKRQGLGMYTFRNGETQSGHWQNGLLETLSTQSTNPGSPISVNHSKVLNAVQEARRAAETAYDAPKVDDRVNKSVSAANKAANAARVAAVKAVQKQIPSNNGDIPIAIV
ncbi:uncharacterized protein LOC135637318 [Musa acuminata AAA Group]|uniref:uncharacterized protein LOC135637318 n=1 Tax=Musa acuminata AAA Group TaxID=214697 RepID=UPI0031CE0F92